MELNQEFLVEVLYTHCRRPIHKKYQNVYSAECPVCKEGKSAGRSRRLFYFPHKQYFFCHNCSKSWRPFEWVKEITNLTVSEIIKRNAEKLGNVYLPVISQAKLAEPLPDLPDNSIEITDDQQYTFYKDNKYIKLAYDYCIQRRLFTAINGCKRFFVSLDDKVHKHRLVIPFFDQNKKVVCYQTRALTPNQFPKYLTKFGEKELFNVDNIDESVPYIFVFEGPIDSMFVRNGVAMASLSPTDKQRHQLSTFFSYEIIYVFDNDKNNTQTQQKIEKYIRDGHKIFVWPTEFLKFKDFNEVCCNLRLDEIPWKFVVKHAMSGTGAMIKQRLTAHSRSS